MKTIRRNAAIMCALLFAADVAFGQQQALSLSQQKPTIDGAVAPTEYGFAQQVGQVTLSLSRTADTLSIGVVGNTTGWVALGLGSLKMDKSTIFMGFVDAEGKVQLVPQIGVGNAHSAASAAVNATVISSSMKEADGKTILEVALKADSYIKSGQDSLQIILAVGRQDSLFGMHSYRGSITVKLVP